MTHLFGFFSSYLWRGFVICTYTEIEHSSETMRGVELYFLFTIIRRPKPLLVPYHFLISNILYMYSLLDIKIA